MQPALDEAWFDRYRAIKVAIGDAYELLEPLPSTLQSARTEFEASHSTSDISLLADRFETELYDVHLAELERLRQDILTSETDISVKDAYLDALHDLTLTCHLLIAGSTGDKEAYNRANLELYDQPDKEVFGAICHWIRDDAEKALTDDNKELARLASAVIELVPNRGTGHHQLIPSEKVFHQVRKLHQDSGYYEMLFGENGIPSSPYVAQFEGDDICRDILKNIGSEWSVTTAENNLWAVMRSRKQLVCPPGYRLDRNEFIGIVSHEIGSHILEEVNGEKQRLKLLGTGLAGFEKGNEGRAFLREQIVYDSERTFLSQFAWEYIILLHFSVSLATGLDRKPYTFSELFKTLRTLYAFWREKRIPGSTNNDLFAYEEAWYLAVRIMKGTDGLGGGYMKDTVYLEGNIRCWQLAKKDPGIILLGDQGMFDIANPKHMQLLHYANQ